MGTYLSRTFSGANTSRKTFTLSFWVKRAKLGSAAIISAETTSNFYDQIIFVSSDQLDVNNVASGSDVISFKTNAVFKDPSAWYHVVIGIDTTQVFYKLHLRLVHTLKTQLLKLVEMAQQHLLAEGKEIKICMELVILLNFIMLTVNKK
jgi:hypothetical protein